MSCMLMMVTLHFVAGQAGVVTTLQTSPEERIDIKYHHSKNDAEPKSILNKKNGILTIFGKIIA